MLLGKDILSSLDELDFILLNGKNAFVYQDEILERIIIAFSFSC